MDGWMEGRKEDVGEELLLVGAHQLVLFRNGLHSERESLVELPAR